MVMEASGSSERKYCHLRGGGQRLMRTSRRLMERSTSRLTTTGTNSEPPCSKLSLAVNGSSSPMESLVSTSRRIWELLFAISCCLLSCLGLGTSRSMREMASSSVIPSSR